MLSRSGEAQVIHLERTYAAAAAAKLLQSCLTLCNPMDCSLPGSSVHEIPGKSTGVGCHFFLQENSLEVMNFIKSTHFGCMFSIVSAALEEKVHF